MRLRTYARVSGGVLALFASSVALAQLQPTLPNLVYATLGGHNLLLDLYIPSTGTPPYPVVVWIHGGGWSAGSRYPAGFAQPLTDVGIAVASIEYRLTSQAGQYGAEPVISPAQINDVKGAVRWLRAHASQYQLDRSRFGSWGSSAGGHLSALLGTSGGVEVLEGTTGGNLAFSSRIAACADYFGPTDIININLDITTPPGSTLDHDAPSSPESHLVGWDGPGQGIGNIRANLTNPNPPYPALVALCNQVNPVTFVTPGDPPFFIGHGLDDTVVPIAQSTRLANALAAAGVFHDYRQVPGAGHGSLDPDTDTAAVQFFQQRLAALPTVPGDLNGDRHVGLADLAILLGAFGANARGDVDYDGDTDLEDLAQLLSNFGR